MIKGGRKYAMNEKKDKDAYLHDVTMIDLATNWIEIRFVPETRADLVANQVELAWLTRYSLPNEIIVVRGNDLLAELKAMKAKDFVILCNLIRTINPQGQRICGKGATNHTCV